MKLDELKVGRKLQIYAFFVSLIFILAGLMALNRVGLLSGYIEHAYTDNVKPMVKINGILEQLLEHQILLRRHILSSSMEEMKKLRGEIAKMQAEVIALTEARDKYRLTDEEEKVFVAFTNNLKLLFNGSQEILQLSEVFAKEDADKKMLTEERPIFERSKEALLKLVKIKEEDVKADYEASVALKKTTWLMTILIIFGGLGIVIISSVFITRSISGAINAAVNAIVSTSSQIISTVAQHERTASNQSAMVTETATTVEELGASSRITAQQAETAAETARKAGAMTGQGKDVVEQAVTAMDGLKDKVGEIASQILRLAEQTTRINSIANLVKDLAGEINMLALNASVEAVRAGESGKGFAVVAGEVRKLAEQSKKSAEQASLIVSDIQKSANSTIMITEDGTKRVEIVREHARKVGEIFDSISSSASGVYDNAQQVLLNTRQQMAAVGQVVEAINGINTGAKETSAGISQTKTGVEQLNKAAQSLKRMA